jgi:hypothetical protein
VKKGLHEVGDVGEDVYKGGRRVVRKAGNVVKKGLHEVGDVAEDVGKGTAKVAKKVGKGALKVVKFVGLKANPVLMAARNSFLLLLKLNIGNLAGALYKLKTSNDSHYEKARRRFTNLGGSEEAFDNNVMRGGKKKPILGIKLIGADGSVSYLYAEPVSTGTIVAGALSVTAAVLPVVLQSVQGSKVDKSIGEGQVSQEEANAMADSVDGATPEQKKRIAQSIMNGVPLEEAAMSEGLEVSSNAWIWWTLGITAAVGVGIALYYMSKNANTTSSKPSTRPRVSAKPMVKPVTIKITR